MSSFQITVSPVVNAISVEDSSPVVEINGTVSTATGAAGGDLAGNYPNPTVDGLQGRALASTAPTNGQAIVWNTALSQWEPGSPAASVADGDKGDITVSGGGGTWTIDAGAVTETKIGSQAVTDTKIATSAVTETKIASNAVTASKIANGAVTLSKIENISPGLIGNLNSVPTGPVSSIGIGAGLGFNISDQLVLADRTARSVMGNPTAGTAAPTDIVAANDGEVLRRSGTTIGFGSIPASSVTAAGSSGQVMFNSGGAFAGDSGLTYNAATDTLTVGALSLANGEFISNSTDGEIKIGPSPSAANRYGITLNGTNNSVGVEFGTFVTSTDSRTVADFLFNRAIVMGNAVNFAFGSAQWYNLSQRGSSQTCLTMALVLGTLNATSSGSFVITDSVSAGGSNRIPTTDHADPTFYVYGRGNSNAADYVRINHNTTDGTVECGRGKLTVKGASAVRIESSTGGFDLPATAGSNGQVLTTDGTNASWATPTGGGVAFDEVMRIAFIGI